MRLLIVKQVQQLLDAGLKIDILGNCMHNKDFPPEFSQNNHASYGDYGPNGKHFFEFLSKYKFYLNFENSNCKYVWVCHYPNFGRVVNAICSCAATVAFRIGCISRN